MRRPNLIRDMDSLVMTVVTFENAMSSVERTVAMFDLSGRICYLGEN